MNFQTETVSPIAGTTALAVGDNVATSDSEATATSEASSVVLVSTATVIPVQASSTGLAAVTSAPFYANGTDSGVATSTIKSKCKSTFVTSGKAKPTGTGAPIAKFKRGSY